MKGRVNRAETTINQTVTILRFMIKKRTNCRVVMESRAPSKERKTDATQPKTLKETHPKRANYLNIMRRSRQNMTWSRYLLKAFKVGWLIILQFPLLSLNNNLRLRNKRVFSGRNAIETRWTMRITVNGGPLNRMVHIKRNINRLLSFPIINREDLRNLRVGLWRIEYMHINIASWLTRWISLWR